MRSKLSSRRKIYSSNSAGLDHTQLQTTILERLASDSEPEVVDERKANAKRIKGGSVFI